MLEVGYPDLASVDVQLALGCLLIRSGCEANRMCAVNGVVKTEIGPLPKTHKTKC